jgi:hypothetical protein
MAQISQRTDIQPASAKPPDIPTLTDQAEAGKGCALGHQLASMSFGDTIKTLKQISVENENRRKTNPDLPEITFTSAANNGDYTGNGDYSGDNRLLLELESNNKQVIGAGLFQASWLIDDKASDMSKIGERTDACKDWTGPAHTDEGKFIYFT